ncbi:MAG: 50S ribosomal protein L30e [Candidatus Hydrothermarchaeota archaeon]|nr:MAG: 50S ribosomal protein L30e [Candidatus Hydrothermarchaeota archaeon]
MSIERAIRVVVETGKVTMGHRETLRAVKNKEAKLVIVAENCPRDLREDLEYYAKTLGIDLYEFKGTSLELGSVCGRPHVVSMLGVVEEGESNIVEMLRRK